MLPQQTSFSHEVTASMAQPERKQSSSLFRMKIAGTTRQCAVLFVAGDSATKAARQATSKLHKEAASRRQGCTCCLPIASTNSNKPNRESPCLPYAKKLLESMDCDVLALSKCHVTIIHMCTVCIAMDSPSCDRAVLNETNFKTIQLEVWVVHLLYTVTQF